MAVFAPAYTDENDKLRIPQPVKLGFDPLGDSDARDPGSVEFFRHRTATILLLSYKIGHLEGPDDKDRCLVMARDIDKMIESSEIESPYHLGKLLHDLSEGWFFEKDLLEPECGEILQQLFDWLVLYEPFKYTVCTDKEL